MLTEEDYGDGYKDHENVVVSQHRHQPLDTDRETHAVGHGEGLLATVMSVKKAQ